MFQDCKETLKLTPMRQTWEATGTEASRSGGGTGDRGACASYPGKYPVGEEESQGAEGRTRMGLAELPIIPPFCLSP